MIKTLGGLFFGFFFIMWHITFGPYKNNTNLKEFFQIGSCLDSGGVWQAETRTCLTE